MQQATNVERDTDMSNRRTAKGKPEAYDFDAFLAEKVTDLPKPKHMKIRGTVYELPAAIPLSVTVAVTNGQQDAKGNTRVLLSTMQNVLADLYGVEQWNDIASKIDLSMVVPLFERTFALYGTDSGESSGSGQS